MPEPPSGLLILDKPAGPTSFDCVRQVRRVLRQNPVGHCGTLDPLARGVLLLLFGRATSRQQEFLRLEKQYWFRAEFGVKTDTGDREGRVLENRPWEPVPLARLQAVARDFVGQQLQTPPRFSAVKVQGKRSYQWARRGVDLPRMPRTVQIHSFEVLALEGAFWEARVVCSRGTYIRSLVEDLASRLGTVATLDALVRERVGSYRREQALSWLQVCAATREQLLQQSLPLPKDIC
jgi:tRNA pseudouridine55 synthase